MEIRKYLQFYAQKFCISKPMYLQAEWKTVDPELFQLGIHLGLAW